MPASQPSRSPGSVVRCPACQTANRLHPTPRGWPRCGACRAPLPWIVDADLGSFGAETQSSLPVVIDFWAPWCGPCRMVGPALEALARKHAGRIKLVRVDVDEAPALASQWRAMSIPTLLVLRDGRERDRLVGALPPAALEARLARWLADPQPGEAFSQG